MTSECIVNRSIRKQYRECDENETAIHGMPILPLISARFIETA
jgi:hypothetical protein